MKNYIVDDNLHIICSTTRACEKCDGKKICDKYEEKYGVTPFVMNSLFEDIERLTPDGKELFDRIYKQK